MRGSDERSGELFSYVDLEERVPAKHPLRKIRQLVNDVLKSLDAEFATLYAVDGRPSIPPERLLRAALLQGFYTIRSERQLMEQLDYNLLFRWFVGLGIDDAVWVPTVFTKNRDRLLAADVAKKFLAALLNHREVRPLLSDEHFSVDGTQIQAWASMKSFVPKQEAAAKAAGSKPSDEGQAEPAAAPAQADTCQPDSEDAAEAAAASTPAVSTAAGRGEPDATSKAAPESAVAARVPGETAAQASPDATAAPVSKSEAEHRNAEVDFRGQKRSNDTHVSTTDAQAKLYRKGKGKESKLCYLGHTLMENRNGLVVETSVTTVSGYAERAAAIAMIHSHCPGERQLTLGADKGYDAAEFVAELRQMKVTPHIAQNDTNRRSAIDARTTRHPGYAISQEKRKRIEEPFGWGKTIGGLARPMLRGAKHLAFKFTLTMAAYDLIRLPKLLAAPA